MWLRSEPTTAEEIAATWRPADRRRPGERWGDDAHVRITLRDADATDRLIAALRELGERQQRH